VKKSHEVAGDAEAYSPAEERFNRRRRMVGLVAGPVLFVAILLWPSSHLPPAAHRLSAILALMIVLWMTEALPLAVTALLGPTLAVISGIGGAKVVFASFADPIIFLFIGSFILAQAMFVQRLDRRLAYTALASRFVGQSGFRLILVYALVACVLSMWMSNTATTAMLFPLGLAIVTELGRGRTHDRDFREYAMAMMLVTSFAASIGGMATPVGTPPNLLGKALLREMAGINISFPGWMVLGLPVVAATMTFVIAWLLYPRARKITLGHQATEAVAAELAKLGRVTVGERNVLVAFGITVCLWVGPGAMQLVLGPTHSLVQQANALVPESVAALIGALLLFILPVDRAARRFTITWEQAARIDWGIILLFGGGLAMGHLADTTGLSAGLGSWVANRFPGVGTAGLTVVFTGLAILMSEAASNTAAATIVVPTAIAVAKAAGLSPLEPALGATLGASMGFMMPISTPPNAIVYSSGHIPIGTMIKHGIVLDLVGFVIIVAAVLSLGAFVG
jgi:solute carrier family 13 (sodium-dependent dicarboxylate transporter), member 2/3/5